MVKYSQNVITVQNIAWGGQPASCMPRVACEPWMLNKGCTGIETGGLWALTVQCLAEQCYKKGLVSQLGTLAKKASRHWYS